MYSTATIIKTISFIGAFVLAACIARAVDSPPDGSYPNQNTAEGEDALFSLTTGADNTAMGFDALDSNTTVSDNALASWIWRATRRLNTARYSHTATLLQNGMVLVAGGADKHFTVSASAELYDPASGTWTATGSLNTARGFHTATLLRNGKVLVAGGEGSDFIASASAELYDPASGTWTARDSLNTARVYHTATLLQNRRVLVAGDLTAISVFWRARNWEAGSAKIHWGGSKNRPSRSLSHLCPSRQ